MKKLLLAIAICLFCRITLAVDPGVDINTIVNGNSKAFGFNVDHFDGYAMGTGTEIFNDANGTSTSAGKTSIQGYLYHTWFFNSTSTDAGVYTVKEYVQIGSSSTWLTLSTNTVTGTGTVLGTATTSMYDNYRIGVNKTGTTTGAVEVKSIHYNLRQ